MTVAIDVFRVLAASTSTMMILSPIPSIYRVYKNKSTGVGSIVPLVSMFANCHIAMFFGYLSELYFPVFSTFVVGDILSLTYIAIFYRYSHEHPKDHKVMLMFGIPLLLITIYSIIGGFGLTNQTRREVGQIDGSMGIVATVILYSAPFEKMAQVLKHRSAVFINIHMVCAGTFNNSMWIVYGYLTREWIIFAPNVFCCSAGCFQIILYLVFHPSTHPYTTPLLDKDEQVTSTLSDIELGLIQDSPTKSLTESSCYVPVASPLTHLQKPQH